MFRKPAINNTAKSISSDSLPELVVNLDEHRQESLSGGITLTPDPNLIFKIKKYPSQPFPCDGPGRGGTCD